MPVPVLRMRLACGEMTFKELLALGDFVGAEFRRQREGCLVGKGRGLRLLSRSHPNGCESPSGGG